jgi:hypothetical protein
MMKFHSIKDNRIFRSPKLLLSSIESCSNNSKTNNDETIHDRSNLFDLIRKYNANMKKIDSILNEKFNIIRNVNKNKKA